MKKWFKFLLLFLLCVFMFDSFPSPKNKQNLLSNVNFKSQTQENQKVSYNTILKSYYDDATKNVENPTKSYESFYEEFYEENSDRNLVKSIVELAHDNNNYNSLLEEYYDSYQNISLFSSSEDADYIINDIYNWQTPASHFKRQPIYSSFDYSSLKIGDIVYETDTVFFNLGHNAIIYELEHMSDFGKYIQTVEAVAGGVQFGYLDDLRMVQYKCIILSICGDEDDLNRGKAVFFAMDQVGKPYFLHVGGPNTSLGATTWYCSELVYASWKYAGVDIGVKKDSNGNDVFVGDVIYPQDIYNSYNTYELMDYDNHPYLDLSLVKKEGSTWTIKITNNTYCDRQVYYNKQLCFLNDGLSWKNLNSVSFIILNYHAYATIQVTDNFFASTVAVCFVTSYIRYISCADQMNTQNLTLVQHNNTMVFGI